MPAYTLISLAPAIGEGKSGAYVANLKPVIQEWTPRFSSTLLAPAIREYVPSFSAVPLAPAIQEYVNAFATINLGTYEAIDISIAGTDWFAEPKPEWPIFFKSVDLTQPWLITPAGEDWLTMGSYKMLALDPRFGGCGFGLGNQWRITPSPWEDEQFKIVAGLPMVGFDELVFGDITWSHR